MIIPIFIHRDGGIPYWTCWNCGELNHPMDVGCCKYCNAPEDATFWQFIKRLFGVKSIFNGELRSEKQ